MKHLKLQKWGLASIVAAVIALGAAPQAIAAPTTLVFDGAVYKLDYILLAPNDYQFTLHVDETGYTGGGMYLGALAFNAGSYSSFNLISTPDGASNWNTFTGGLNAGGCNGDGMNWVCIESTANSNMGYGITPLAAHSDDEYVFRFNGITLTDDGIHLKAQYVDSKGKKVGSLISEGISPPPVPEPETYAMLLVGLGMLGLTARRRKNTAA